MPCSSKKILEHGNPNKTKKPKSPRTHIFIPSDERVKQVVVLGSGEVSNCLKYLNAPLPSSSGSPINQHREGRCGWGLVLKLALAL